MSYTRFRVNLYKELFIWKRHVIWTLSHCNVIQNHIHLVYKRTLDRFIQTDKWLSCVASTYLYDTFECVFLPCHIPTIEWIYILQLPHCQETPCLKQTLYLNSKWLLDRLRPNNRLVWNWTNNHLAKLAKWLICAVTTYLYGERLCVLIMPHVRFRRNL